MRYYEINIMDSKNQVIRQYSSLRNGVYNPGCLMIEFDIPRYGESTPAGEARLAIWGIGPQEMQQARQDLYGKKIQIFVGMSPGLPLAGKWNKKLAIEGTIFQVFGNWQGTDLRLDFIIVSGPINESDPERLTPIEVTFPWRAGSTLSSALTQCLMTIGGGFRPNISVSDRLVLNYDWPMFCGSLRDLAQQIKALSRSKIRDPGYSGVEIAVVNGKEIRVWDNDYRHHPDSAAKSSATARSKNPIQIEFVDLVGQPTWINFGVVSLICVMRSDIQTGDHILMPKRARPMIQASSYSHYRDDSAFTGEFVVQSVRLLGNSRQPNAESWITIIEAGVYQSVGEK
ncbi:hypothetical protein G5645_07310 [Pectobacterium carotovorum]|uniref:hypothetical protein n=1 Tax=Pectobacterium carotovorum TaxID=554 RepID=UPI00191D00BE|nr:hypothetical protein [Pectobacterium carotovorum]MBL0907802.1 hypothetical protein [Pectobacterium carotovorum]